LLAKAIGVRPNQVDVSWDAIDDRDQAMLATLRAAREGLGRWPTAAQWDASGRRPAARTFTRHFGGWREACRAAAAGGWPELTMG
jgi:Homing endonuclease associated repeat